MNIILWLNLFDYKELDKNKDARGGSNAKKERKSCRSNLIGKNKDARGGSNAKKEQKSCSPNLASKNKDARSGSNAKNYDINYQKQEIHNRHLVLFLHGSKI